MDMFEVSRGVSFTEFHNVINGKLRDSEITYHGINPATTERLWPAPVATEDDLDDAVKAAHDKFYSWAKTSIENRKRLVGQWAKSVKTHEEEFANLLIYESGKPRLIANLEVTVSLETLMQSCMFTPQLAEEGSAAKDIRSNS